MGKIKYLFLLISILVLVGCSEEEPVHVPKKQQNVEVERTVIKKVYVPEESFDEYDPYNGEITETSASYWYVYYEYEDGTDNYQGYKVVEIDVPYYDVNKVILAIRPDLNNKDFYKEDNGIWLGVKFFNRVSFETYRNYQEDKNK